jgi:two-component system, NtrC family, sensor kinase
MRKSYCLISLLFLLVTGNAQRRAVDSLQQLLKQEKTDTAKWRKLLQIGAAYRDMNNDSALIFYHSALNLAGKAGYVNGEIEARSVLANYLVFTKNEFATALTLYLKNLEVEEEIGDTTTIFTDTRGIGLLYARIEDYEQEFAYVKKLDELVNAGIFKDSKKVAGYRVIVDSRYGGAYLNRNKTDSAKYFMTRVFQAGELANDPYWIALGSLGLGDVYSKIDNADSAIYFYELCIPAANKANRRYIVINCLNGIGQLFWTDGQPDSAFFYTQKAFDQASAMKSASLMGTAAALLSDIYALNNKPDSAYKYLHLSVELEDSVLNAEKISEVQSINLKKSLEQAQLLQMKQEAVREYKDRVKTYILVAGIVGLLVFLLLMYRISLQRARANKKIAQAYESLKATQAQLIQSEKMASLGELTAGIAHEIQNPLNFVNNFSEINKELIGEMKTEMDKGNLEEVHLLASGIESNEEKINHHGKRADAIVKGMLQHSRSSTGTKEPTDINLLADEYVRLAFHGFRARDNSFNAVLKTDFDPRIGMINIIPQDIGRVILNLITNAFYVVHEKKKSSPEAAAEDKYEPTVSVSTKRSNGQVQISVKDNGNGIPSKVLDKIFQPFFTTKPTGQGTGLGLSLSYDIVKAHGGELKVATREGEGSEFIVILP